MLDNTNEAWDSNLTDDFGLSCDFIGRSTTYNIFYSTHNKTRGSGADSNRSSSSLSSSYRHIVDFKPNPPPMRKTFCFVPATPSPLDERNQWTFTILFTTLGNLLCFRAFSFMPRTSGDLINIHRHLVPIPSLVVVAASRLSAWDSSLCWEKRLGWLQNRGWFLDFNDKNQS